MFSARGPSPADASKTSPGFGVEADKSPPGGGASERTEQTEKKLLGKEPNARPGKPDSLKEAATADRPDQAGAVHDDKPEPFTSAMPQPQADLAALVALEVVTVVPVPTAQTQRVEEAVASIPTSTPAAPPVAGTPGDIAGPIPTPEMPPATDETGRVHSDLSSDEVGALGIQSVTVDPKSVPVEAAVPTDEPDPITEAKPPENAPHVPGAGTDEYAPATDEYAPASDEYAAASVKPGKAATDEGAPASDNVDTLGKGAKVGPLPPETTGNSGDQPNPGSYEETAGQATDEANASQDRAPDTINGDLGKQVAGTRSTQAPDGAPVRGSVDRVAVVRQVADRIELLAAAPRDGVTVRLEPRDLGSITLVVKSHGDEVEAHILASNEAVRGALEGSRTQLRDALEARGLNLGAMTVGQEASRGQTERDAATHNAQASRAFASTIEQGGGVAAGTDWRVAARSSQGMDLWI